MSALQCFHVPELWPSNLLWYKYFVDHSHLWILTSSTIFLSHCVALLRGLYHFSSQYRISKDKLGLSCSWRTVLKYLAFSHPEQIYTENPLWKFYRGQGCKVHVTGKFFHQCWIESDKSVGRNHFFMKHLHARQSSDLSCHLPSEVQLLHLHSTYASLPPSIRCHSLFPTLSFRCIRMKIFVSFKWGW